MKKIFFGFIILVAVIAVGFLIHKDPGYAIVSYDHWVLSTSIWVAAASLLLAFFILYFAIRFMACIFSLPAYFRHKRLFRNAKKYREYMTQGISELITGDFKSAEKNFLSLAEKNESYVEFLLAAQAAQAQNAFDRRDQYLQKAFLFGKEATFAISLTQAQFFMKSEQWEAALAILKSLHSQAPKNPLVLSALKTIYFKSHEWESLKLLLPQLRKQQLISEDEMNQMKAVTV